MNEPNFKFYLPIRVRYYETDQQGHLNFIWHQAYFAMAMADYLKALRYSYHQLTSETFDLLFVDAHSSFHAPCYYDEEISVHCRTEKIGRTSIRFQFKTTAKNGQRLVATGDITVVVVDKKTSSKTAVPELLREAITQFEN